MNPRQQSPCAQRSPLSVTQQPQGGYKTSGRLSSPPPKSTSCCVSAHLPPTRGKHPKVSSVAPNLSETGGQDRSRWRTARTARTASCSPTCWPTGSGLDASTLTMPRSSRRPLRGWQGSGPLAPRHSRPLTDATSVCGRPSSHSRVQPHAVRPETDADHCALAGLLASLAYPRLAKGKIQTLSLCPPPFGDPNLVSWQHTLTPGIVVVPPCTQSTSAPAAIS